MRESHRLDRSQRGLVEIGEFSRSVFLDRAVRFPGLVRVPENPWEELVDADFFRGRLGRRRIRGGGCGSQEELKDKISDAAS